MPRSQHASTRSEEREMPEEALTISPMRNSGSSIASGVGLGGRVPSAAPAQKFQNLMGWFERIEAVGYGELKAMEPDEALKIARESSPATPVNVQAADSDTLKAGAMVSVT